MIAGIHKFIYKVRWGLLSRLPYLRPRRRRFSFIVAPRSVGFVSGTEQLYSSLRQRSMFFFISVDFSCRFSSTIASSERTVSSLNAVDVLRTLIRSVLHQM